MVCLKRAEAYRQSAGDPGQSSGRKKLTCLLDTGRSDGLGQGISSSCDKRGVSSEHTAATKAAQLVHGGLHSSTCASPSPQSDRAGKVKEAKREIPSSLAAEASGEG